MKNLSILYIVLLLLLSSCGKKIVCVSCKDKKDKGGKNFIPKKIFRPFFKKDIKCDKIRGIFRIMSKKRKIKQHKPVIYLYPKQTDTLSVKLNYKSDFLVTYPEYKNGWKVIADTLGNLTDLQTGKKYYCLFWEGKDFKSSYSNLSEGFVIKGDSTADFLETTLKSMGLNDRETNEFIIFWLPRMINNPYNFISFSGKEYEELASLEIEPKPDAILRVHMNYKALNKKITVTTQVLPKFERKGFTVIEWGGSEIDEPK